MTSSPSVKMLHSILLAADDDSFVKKKRNVRCYSLDLNMIEQEKEIVNPYLSPRTLYEAESEDNIDVLGQWGDAKGSPIDEGFFDRDPSTEPIKIERRSSQKWQRQDYGQGGEENSRLELAKEQRMQLSKIIPSIAKEIENEEKNDRYITSSFQLQANIIDHLQRYILDISLPAVEEIDELKQDIFIERRKSALELESLHIENDELKNKIDQVCAKNREAENKVEDMRIQFRQALEENEVAMEPDEYVDEKVVEKLAEELEETQSKLSLAIEEAQNEATEKEQLEDILHSFYDKIEELQDERDFVKSQITKCEKMLLDTQEELRARNEEVLRVKSESKLLDEQLQQEYLERPSITQTASTEIVEIPFEEELDESDLPESLFSLVQDGGMQIYKLNHELEVEEYENEDDVWLDEEYTPEPVTPPDESEEELVPTTEDLVEEFPQQVEEFPQQVEVFPQNDQKESSEDFSKNVQKDEDDEKSSSQRNEEKMPRFSLRDIPELSIGNGETVTILGTFDQNESSTYPSKVERNWGVTTPEVEIYRTVLTIGKPNENVILPVVENVSPVVISAIKEERVVIPIESKSSSAGAKSAVEQKASPVIKPMKAKSLPRVTKPVKSKSPLATKPDPAPAPVPLSSSRPTLRQTHHLKLLKKRKTRQRMGAKDFSEALTLFKKLEKVNPKKVKPKKAEKSPIVKDMITMIKTSNKKPSPKTKASKKVVARVRKKRKHHFLNPRKKGHLQIPHSFQFSRKKDLHSGHRFYVCLDALPCRVSPKPNEQFWAKDRKNADLRPCIFWFENQDQFIALQVETAGMHVRSKEFQTKFTELVTGLIVIAPETSAVNSVELKAIERLRTLTGKIVTLMPGFVGFAKKRVGTEADFFLLVKSWDRESYVSHKFRANSKAERDTWIFRIRKFLNQRLQHSRAISSAFMSMGEPDKLVSEPNTLVSLDKITRARAKGLISKNKKKTKSNLVKSMERNRGHSGKTTERTRVRNHKGSSSAQQKKDSKSVVKTSSKSYNRSKSTSPKLVHLMNKDSKSVVKTSPKSNNRAKSTSPKLVIPLNIARETPALAIKLCVDQLFDLKDTSAKKKGSSGSGRTHRSKKPGRTGGGKAPEKSGGRPPDRTAVRTSQRSSAKSPKRSAVRSPERSGASKSSEKPKKIRRTKSHQKITRNKKIERVKDQTRIK